MKGCFFWANCRSKEPFPEEKDFSSLIDDLIEELDFVRARSLSAREVEDRFFVPFPGGGMTIFQAIGESSITIHTYPELSSFRLEISSCKLFSSLTAFSLLVEKSFIEGVRIGMISWEGKKLG